MNVNQIDKNLLKSLIKEIIKEDALLFKDTIKEILLEHKVIVSSEQAERRKRLEKILNDNFDRYDEVFKALA